MHLHGDVISERVQTYIQYIVCSSIDPFNVNKVNVSIIMPHPPSNPVHLQPVLPAPPPSDAS